MIEKLEKLKFNSILQLTFFAPSEYRDLRLHSSYKVGEFSTIQCKIFGANSTPKLFSVKLFAHNLNCYIDAIFFNAKQWQKAQFVDGEEITLYGKINFGFNGLQIVQPIKVTSTNIITPIYKTHLQNRTILEIYKNLLTKENLEKELLPNNVIDMVLNIHFPTEKIPHINDYLYALKFCEIFYFLKQISKKKLVMPSSKALLNDPELFINSLPFKLTQDQLRTIQQIKLDLSKDIQAKRLIVGDVGCGKTMVILATAFMVGKNKTILMAPTTLLANQLYEEAKKYLNNFLKIALVSSKQKCDTLQEIDLIVGTHALLYIELPKAKTIIVDEQHKFGTNQRKLLSDLVASGKEKAHFFQFSATPIPRSLAMIQSSLINISTIKTMPFKKDITTAIITKENFKDLLKHIELQIANNAQIIIVYPHIESSEKSSYQSLEEASGFWLKNFNNVYVTHGKDKLKDELLLDFRENGDILLATTVIEVGISLPRVNTVVVAGAERLGLATLHQIRGRAGRMGQKSWCFFYTNNIKNERLNELAKTLDGFKVAELDLKLRDSGDLLSGVVQSGANFKYFDLSTDENILQEVKDILDGR